MRKAFSLSETLTVLTVIGIVAAMVTPVLYANVNEHKMMTMLKKVYSAYNVNIQTVLGEGNCSTLSCLRIYDKVNNNNIHVDINGTPINPGQHNGLLADRRYFNVTSRCVDCFKAGDFLPDGGNVAVDAIGEPTNLTSYILDNSAVVAIQDYAPDGNNRYCVTTNLVRGVSDLDRDAGVQSIPLCGILIIDANGIKGPNIPGKDRFGFYIADEPVEGSYLVAIGHSRQLYQNNANIRNRSNENTRSDVPLGGQSCLPGNTQRGYNCTAKVMAEGWKINY